jgi:hypothetical protein
MSLLWILVNKQVRVKIQLHVFTWKKNDWLELKPILFFTRIGLPEEYILPIKI